MDYMVKTTLRGEMVAEIMSRLADPAGWLLAVRLIGHNLDLRAERYLPIGGGVTLNVVVAAVIDEAAKQDRTPAQVREALREWASYHPIKPDVENRNG